MTPCTDLKFGEMEFGEMKRNTSNWSNFCMFPRRAGLTASAGLSCLLCVLCLCLYGQLLVPLAFLSCGTLLVRLFLIVFLCNLCSVK